MKGFNIAEGYMGWIGYKYMLFACEEDYREYMMEEEF